MQKKQYFSLIRWAVLLPLLIGCSSWARAGDEAASWDQAGREVKEAAGAVQEATVETSKDVWQKTRELWRRTRQTTDESWDSIRQESHLVWDKAIQEAGEALADTKAMVHEATTPEAAPAEEPPAK